MNARSPAIDLMKAWAVGPVLLLVLALPRPLCAPTQAPNLAENASFEADELGYIAMWTMDAQDNRPEAVRFFTTDVEKVSGGRSLAIANLAPNDARAVQWVRTKPDTWYRISCWVQARDVESAAAGANISVLGSTRLAGNLRDTGGRWKYVELLGKTGPEQRAMAVLCRLGFYRNPAKGLALFDDVSIEELSAPPARGYDTVDLSENVEGVAAVTSNAPLKIQTPPGFVPSAVFYWTGAVLAGAALMLALSLPGVAAGARRRAASQTASAAPAGEWEGPYKGIEHRRSPRSAVDVHAVARRRGRGLLAGKFISLRCENLSDNGIFLRCEDPAALRLAEEVTIEAALPTGVLRLGIATVVGVRTRWDAQGRLVNGGFALDFKKSSAAAARVRRRLAAGDGAREECESQAASVPV